MNSILTRGNPLLETPSQPVQWPDPALADELARLQQALHAFRQAHGFGRAIAAPQLGIMKRVIALNLGATPFALINPIITWRSSETFEVWDDCLSVPDSLVRVRRHRSISVAYLDPQGREHHWETLPADLAELIQHEIDHLDGVLMTERAVDADSIRPVSEHATLVGQARPTHRLSLDRIAEAAHSIDPVFLHSPQYDCEALSRHLGCTLTLKLETANPIRSFKGRGADYLLSRVVAEGDTRPMVCASAGNFGQALAYVCRKHARPLMIYASEQANPLKLQRMQELGAELRLTGADFDAAKDAARVYCEAHGAWLVEDGREVSISEGAGSIAVELLARDAHFDGVLIPLGNGALLNGMGRWIKAASPATRVIGVSSAGADAMARSFQEQRVVSLPHMSTIADGIGIRNPIAEAVADMQGVVDEVLLVEDQHILTAMGALFQQAGLLIEPAGAVGVAAILANPQRFAGLNLATVLCGSNLSTEQVRHWLMPDPDKAPTLY